MDRYVAAALLVLAAVVYFKPQEPIDIRGWQPLELPVDLKPGTIRTPDFAASRDTDYLLIIERASNYRADCLLGMPVSRPRCDIPEILDVNWTVLASGTIAASGSSRYYRAGWWSGGRTARKIGQFRATKGLRYTVILDIPRDQSELNPAALLVQTHPRAWKDPHVGQALDRTLRVLATLTLAAAALLILATGWLVRRFRKRAA